MVRWAKTMQAAAVASALAVSGEAAAATIFGTIQQTTQQVNQPVANTQVVLSCGGREVADTQTDHRGTYRLTTDWTGRCELQIRGVSAEVILYRDPTRYDFNIKGESLIRR